MRAALVTPILCLTTIAACAPPSTSRNATAATLVSADPAATLARVFYWRARDGKLAEYNRYVRDVAASKQALARQARSAARRRSAAQRSAAARKAVRTKGPAVRSAAARKAAPPSY